MSDLTRILYAIDAGDPRAAQELLPLVYEELRKLAAHRLASEKPGQTLQATALVHEAYLRLVKDAPPQAAWSHRGHFFAAAAEAMRRILVEQARHKRSLKRGGDGVRVALDAVESPVEKEADAILDLDIALARFAEAHPEKAELVKLRHFVGLSLDETAAMLGIAPATADRWWAYAKSWLRVEIDRLRESDAHS